MVVVMEAVMVVVMGEELAAVALVVVGTAEAV